MADPLEESGITLTTSNISSLVMDTLSNEGSAKVTGFYCDFQDRQEQTAANIIGAILNQLAAKKKKKTSSVVARLQSARSDLGWRRPRLSEVVQMLKQAISSFPLVFICIDALDECLPNHLLELLESLKDILQESPRARIFVTGRPHVETEIVRCFTTSVIAPISPRTHEIKRYLEKRLEMDTMRDAMSDALRADILRIIPKRISKMCVAASTIPTPYTSLY